MTALLTAADAQAAGVGLGMALPALQAIIDAEEAELVRRFGPSVGAVTEVIRRRACDDQSIFVARPIGVITSITEQWYVGDPAPLVRPATDYQVWPAQGRIERAAMSLPWGAVVTVVYTPLDQAMLRRSVLQELTRIAADDTVGGSSAVSGLGYSVGATQGGATTQNQARAAQYARLGWRS